MAEWWCCRNLSDILSQWSFTKLYFCGIHIISYPNRKPWRWRISARVQNYEANSEYFRHSLLVILVLFFIGSRMLFVLTNGCPRYVHMCSFVSSRKNWDWTMAEMLSIWSSFVRHTASWLTTKLGGVWRSCSPVAELLLPPVLASFSPVRDDPLEPFSII